MDPLRTDESNNNADLTQTLQAIMQQLTGISSTLQEQEAKLGRLETNEVTPTTATKATETLQTGCEPERPPPQERSAQRGQFGVVQALLQRLIRDTNRDTPAVSQYGIRAKNLWKTDYELSKDAFKSTPKLESTKDYTVWRFAISEVLGQRRTVAIRIGDSSGT